jgi:hypothetical protein
MVKNGSGLPDGICIYVLNQNPNMGILEWRMSVYFTAMGIKKPI